MKRLGRNFLYEIFLPNLVFSVVVTLLGSFLDVDFLFVVSVLVLSGATSAVMFSFLEKYKLKSSTDQLTGLFNREHVYTTLSSLVEKEKPFYFLLLDLDRFKNVNDTLGHSIGDKLLIAAAKRLAACLRADDIIARLGGDEFGIVVSADSFDYVTLTKRITESLARPFNIGPHVLSLGVSVGVSKFPEHGSSVEQIVKNSDAAMYHAKRDKLGAFYYDKTIDATIFENFMLIGDLKQAIQNDELYNEYQPKVDLRTGKFSSVECLCRWKHKTFGMISPDKFIPIAEQEGMIDAILFKVLENSLRDLHYLQGNGLNLGMSINISAENLSHPEEISKIVSIISKFGISPNTLTFEITETAISKNLENTLKALILLNTFGIKLSIDDFGTGYSSFMYLKHLPISELKVDRAFVSDAASSTQDRMIVNSIIQLAHSAKCEVVAEGVETLEQLELLKQMNCDFAQGFHLSRPLGISDLVKFCQQSNNNP